MLVFSTNLREVLRKTGVFHRQIVNNFRRFVTYNLREVLPMSYNLVYFNFIRKRNKEINAILDDANVTNGMTRDEFLDAVESLGY